MIIAKLMISAPSPKTRLDQGSEGHTLPDGEFETCRDPRCFSGGLCSRKMSEKWGGYFQREWFRTPHDEPHDQNRCVLQVLNLYRF